MKYVIIIALISMNAFCTETRSKGEKGSESATPPEREVKQEQEQGFVFVSISNIYHNGGELIILKKSGSDTLAYINGSEIKINGSSYDIIDQEHLYKDGIDVESFDPEYGLFVLSCKGKVDGFYEVMFNEQIALIGTSSQKIDFKSFTEYIMETYPIPTESNPLRQEPSDNSDLVSEYGDYTYVPVEVKGDWVKVRDDKDCYSGEEPSKVDIVGWIKWREGEKFILKVAYIC